MGSENTEDALSVLRHALDIADFRGRRAGLDTGTCDVGTCSDSKSTTFTMGQTPFVEKGDWEVPTLTTLCGVALAGAGLISPAFIYSSWSQMGTCISVPGCC